jgi:ATP-dependent DNA ligase
LEFAVMMRAVKRSAAGPIKTSGPRGRQDAPLPRRITPQLCQLVESAPSGPQWLHEIKLDGFRMSGRIERGRVQLLTRTGLDWSDKYPSVIAALAKVRAKTSYLDGEPCGIGDDGLPSFSQTQANDRRLARDAARLRTEFVRSRGTTQEHLP